MSEEEFGHIGTSLTTPVLNLSCSFNTYDGVFLTMKESNRHSIRQLKKRVLKELSSLSLSDLSSSKSMIEPEEIICVDSKQSSLSFKSTLSSKTNKSDTIDIEGFFWKIGWRIGCEEQLDRLKEFIRENPKSLTCARLFCMGRELKSNASLKRFNWDWWMTLRDATSLFSRYSYSYSICFERGSITFREANK